MNRPTDLDRFLSGVKRLKERGITPSIDLIVGLPGDDLAAFKRSVDYVAGHDLADDMQVFPLSILPGTDFRNRAQALGLSHHDAPPYGLIGSTGFSEEAMFSAFRYAEKTLDTVLFPLPDLDASYRAAGGFSDHWVNLGDAKGLWKLLADPARSMAFYEKAVSRLTQPWQLLVPPGRIDMDWLSELIARATTKNPHSPFEVIFFEPEGLPDTRRLLAAARGPRPHFLDGDLRYLHPEAGNRSVMFTLVDRRFREGFSGAMHRNVFWWTEDRLPRKAELAEFLDNGLFDAVLVDADVEEGAVCRFQDDVAPEEGDFVFLSFGKLALQRRWLALAASDQYWDGAFDPVWPAP